MRTSLEELSFLMQTGMHTDLALMIKTLFRLLINCLHFADIQHLQDRHSVL